MTKEELKQEAEEWLRSTDNHLNEEKTHFLSESEYAERAYLASAEPREKKIESLGERCLQLQKDKGELIDKTRELERKIASIRGSHRVDLAKLNARIEQVERLKKENAELKILVSSILYEINALWDISEMNEDVRKHAERVDSEVEK